MFTVPLNGIMFTVPLNEITFTVPLNKIVVQEENVKKGSSVYIRILIHAKTSGSA